MTPPCPSGWTHTARRSHTTGQYTISSAKRVLLTGATGFVGSHVARALLRAGCDVHALIRPGSTVDRIADVIDSICVIPGDLTLLADARLLANLRADICLHLAWFAEPARYLHAVPENLAALRAGLDFVEALSLSGCKRLVVAGSCAEYGQGTAQYAKDESAPLVPSTPYARAKAALWLAAQDTARAGGMDLAWARLFFLYGPWEHPDRVVSAAIRACLSHRPFPATPGAQVRDYLHVSDAAAALWAIAISELTGPVNVCSGTAITLRSVLTLIEGATNAPGTIRFGEKPYSPGEWMWMCGDNCRLKSCGWQPAFTTAEGIADTVRWWRERETQTPG